MVSDIRLKREVIQHELGHWVTARHHGIYTDHIEISRQGKYYYGHCNIFIFPKLRDTEDAKKLIESRIRTLMAGAAAQLIDRNGANWSCVMEIFQSNGSNDYDKISEYISFVSGFDETTHMNKENTNDIYSHLLGKYWTETEKVIENNVKTVRTLSDYIISQLDRSTGSIKFSTEELISQIERGMPSCK